MPQRMAQGYGLIEISALIVFDYLDNLFMYLRQLYCPCQNFVVRITLKNEWTWLILTLLLNRTFLILNAFSSFESLL